LDSIESKLDELMNDAQFISTEKSMAEKTVNETK